jgi:hypothetical protein
MIWKRGGKSASFRRGSFCPSAKAALRSQAAAWVTRTELRSWELPSVVYKFQLRVLHAWQCFIVWNKPVNFPVRHVVIQLHVKIPWDPRTHVPGYCNNKSSEAGLCSGRTATASYRQGDVGFLQPPAMYVGYLCYFFKKLFCWKLLVFLTSIISQNIIVPRC